MELDANHKARMQYRESMEDPGLLVPEGISPNPKRELYQNRSKSSLGGSSDEQSNKFGSYNSQSAAKLLKKAMTYKFQLADLTKYSQKLRFRDLNWKLPISALGKEIPDENARKKNLKKESYFTKLHRILKNTDWSRTPIFHQFERNGRWMHEDANIYGEQEIKYLKTSLQKMLNQENSTEFQEREGISILNKHFEKVMRTLEILMNQMNMMFYWERLRLYFVDKEPTLDILEKLMSRVLKLYQMIDGFMKVFKLIRKKEVSLYFLLVLFFYANRNLKLS